MIRYTVANRQIFQSAALYLVRDTMIRSAVLRRFNLLSPRKSHIDEEKALNLLVQGLQECEPDVLPHSAERRVREHVARLVRPSKPSVRAAASS
jgi:hypothetical protein